MSVFPFHQEVNYMTKPLFIWAGGKNKMLKHYIPILPSRLETTIESYVEPFFGGGAMFIHIMETHKPKTVYINDINKDVMSIYRCIKDNYDEFLKRVTDLESKYLPMNIEDRSCYPTCLGGSMPRAAYKNKQTVQKRT